MCAKQTMKATHGKWVFIVPIEDVVLTDATRHELRINRVLFVSKEKLHRIRKRLGFPQRISDIQKRYAVSGGNFFGAAQTFAIVHQTGVPDNIAQSCRRLVEDELSILCLSQLGYCKRQSRSYPRLSGAPKPGLTLYGMFNSENISSSLDFRQLGTPFELTLNARWKKFQQKVFFWQLLPILQGKYKIADKWKNDIRVAATLVGRGLQTTNLSLSFLWNMIALERLLTHQGDKYTDVLPKRIEAFLGWIGFWHEKDYANKIGEVYAKRCNFVHEGESDNITVADLLFTDDLLLNLFANIVRHIDLFKSKHDIFAFADKVQAEYLLGVKPKVRPRSLIHIARTYTDADLRLI